MWMKLRRLAVVYICTFSYVMCQPSGINYCEPGGTGYQECEVKKALCKIKDNSYVCECRVGMHFNAEGSDGECEEIDMCSSDSQGYRYCESSLELCRNAPDQPKGYECYCAEGKIKIDGLCQDSSDVETPADPMADSSSSSFLSSSVLSSSGIEHTTFETFSDSSKITYTFTPSPEPYSTHSPSTFDIPLSTSTYDHESSSLTSDAQNDDECSRLRCSQNATCIKLSHGLTCQCKVGFVPHKGSSLTKSHCYKNCTVQGCEDTCKEIKCILKEEDEKSTNASACFYCKSRFSGWPVESIITCIVLAVIIIILVTGSALLCHRYKKLQKMRQFEEKQIVYRKMDKGSLCNESKDNLVFKGIDYI